MKRFSRLRYADTPNRVATFSWCSQSSNEPLGPNSFVVGIHQTVAPVAMSRVNCLAVNPSWLRLLPAATEYQKPGVSSPFTQAVPVKPGRKNSSASTRSWASQNGWEPITDRLPPMVLMPAYALNLGWNW